MNIASCNLCARAKGKDIELILVILAQFYHVPERYERVRFGCAKIKGLGPRSLSHSRARSLSRSLSLPLSLSLSLSFGITRPLKIRMSAFFPQGSDKFVCYFENYILQAQKKNKCSGLNVLRAIEACGSFENRSVDVI